LYIAFEGIDLVGKSSQIELMKKEFPNFIFTKEPGGTEFGKKIREIVLHDNFELSRISEFLLFLSDRSEHYQKVIKPNLENGKIVVSDRTLISGMAYALQNGGISKDEVLNLNLMVIEKKLPDLTIFIKISENELMKRRSLKSHDNIENRGIQYALEVQNLLEYWIDKLDLNVLTIDASNSIDDIFQDIKNKIDFNLT